MQTLIELLTRPVEFWEFGFISIMLLIEILVENKFREKKEKALQSELESVYKCLKKQTELNVIFYKELFGDVNAKKKEGE